MNYINKVITLVDNNKYLVIEQVDLDNHTYLYIVNDSNEKDSKFVEVTEKGISQIDPTLFQEKIYPLFISKLKKDA